MMPQLPPKIQDALKALEVFERDVLQRKLPGPSRDAIAKFVRALMSLWRFIDSNKDKNIDQVEVVKRQRILYVRRFLETWSDLPTMLEEDWYYIRIVLSSYMDEDLERLFREHQDLKSEYESFCNQYPNDVFERWKEQLREHLTKILESDD